MSAIDVCPSSRVLPAPPYTGICLRTPITRFAAQCFRRGGSEPADRPTGAGRFNATVIASVVLAFGYEIAHSVTGASLSPPSG
jgi:hypothetical protein